jgi:alkylation response protein AidB-like acyl-CoA dehydrogenase
VLVRNVYMSVDPATPVTGGWRIDGRKWFISGAHGAGFAVCMARTSGAPGERGGATMFLVDADNPGMSVVRDIETLDEGLFGGHSEVVFDGCVVGPSSVLGEVDRGFEYAQVRLGPACLTHCMRWLGLARRAHGIAVDWAATRKSFGGLLGDLGMVQQLVADSGRLRVDRARSGCPGATGWRAAPMRSSATSSASVSWGCPASRGWTSRAARRRGLIHDRGQFRAVSGHFRPRS